MAEVDSKNPAELAADAATDVQALAAVLTHAGARPDAIAGLHQMVTVLNGIHQQLASAPLSGQAPQPQAATPPGPPAQGPPPPGPPQAAPAGKPESPQKLHTRAALHAASAALQASMAASAKK